MKWIFLFLFLTTIKSFSQEIHRIPDCFGIEPKLYNIETDSSYQYEYIVQGGEIISQSSNILSIIWSNNSYSELSVFVYDRRGCSNVSTLKIEFIPCDESFIWVPNSFTPNSNNRNDYFKAYGINIKKFEMTIYNRWGEKLFITKNLEQGWDGRYKGKDAQIGVYVYKIIYTDVSNEEKNIVGKVSLIK